MKELEEICLLFFKYRFSSERERWEHTIGRGGWISESQQCCKDVRRLLTYTRQRATEKMRKYIERKMKTSLIVDVNELSLLCTYFRWLVAERGSFTGLHGDDFESIFLQLWTRLEPRHAIQLFLWATTRVGKFISRIYFGFQTPLHCVSQSATLIIIILHEASAAICRVCVCILQHRHGELFSLFLLHEIIIIWLCLWSWLRFPIRRSCPSLLISRRGAQSEKKRVRIFILCTSTTNRPMSTNDGGRGNGEERAEFLFCSFLFFLSRAYNFFKIAWCVFYARRAASRIARLSSRSAH